MADSKLTRKTADRIVRDTFLDEAKSKKEELGSRKRSKGEQGARGIKK